MENHDDNPNPTETVQNETAMITKPELLLNIMGFALHSARDFHVFACVNKQWNQLTKDPTPLLMPRIEKDLARYVKVDSCEPRHCKLPKEEVDLFLDMVFFGLKNTEGGLYGECTSTTSNNKVLPPLDISFCFKAHAFLHAAKDKWYSVIYPKFYSEQKKIAAEFVQNLGTTLLDRFSVASGEAQAASPDIINEGLAGAMKHWKFWQAQSGVLNKVGLGLKNSVNGMGVQNPTTRDFFDPLEVSALQYLSAAIFQSADVSLCLRNMLKGLTFYLKQETILVDQNLVQDFLKALDTILSNRKEEDNEDNSLLLEAFNEAFKAAKAANLV